MRSSAYYFLAGAFAPAAAAGSAALAAAFSAWAFISASFFCVGVIKLRSPGFCARSTMHGVLATELCFAQAYRRGSDGLLVSHFEKRGGWCLGDKIRKRCQANFRESLRHQSTGGGREEVETRC